MGTEQVEWLPALIALAAGMAVAVALLLRSSRGAVAAEGPDLVLRDLEAERDALLAQLAELAELGSTRTAAQLALERRELELRAAAVLRSIDRHKPARSRATAAPPPQPLARSPWLGFAAGAGLTAALAVAVLLVSKHSDERAPAPDPAAAPAAVSSAETARLERAVGADPENAELRMQLVRQLMMEERLMDVWAHTQFLLQRDPTHPEALSFQALVRLAMGQPDAALSMLDTALERDPDLLDAHVHRALVYAQTGHPDQAEVAILDAIERHPDQKAALEGLLASLRGM